MKFMRKLLKFIKNRRFILLLIVSILLLLLLIPNNNGNSTEYIFEEVKRTDLIEKVTANGIVKPQLQFNLNSKINAKVIKVNVNTSDIVSKDQELVRLDDTDLQSIYKSAMYSFNSAVYARDKLKNTPMIDDYSVKQAQQQVNIAWVNVENAKRNLDNAIIKSPIDGVVLAVNVKEGDYLTIAQLQPAIIIRDNSSFIAELFVNELDISKVKIDQSIEFEIDALEKRISGKVLNISPIGVNNLGIVNFEVKASIDEQDGLMAEMTINGDIIVNTKENILTLPQSAIRQNSGKSFVYTPVFNDKNELINVLEKEIAIGLNNGFEVEILDGLNESDKVILNYDLTVNTFNFNFR